MPMPMPTLRLRGAPPPLHPSLPGVHYLQGLFPPEFLEKLEELQWGIVPTKSSNNMYCTRAFFNDAALAAELLGFLPGWLGYSHVCADLRYLRYPAGGYIAPHVDGVRCDEASGRQTTTSFLLYLETVPEGEGGETEFLTAVQDGELVRAVRPLAGGILLFPHGVPHQGNGVGVCPKVLLRGDLY